MSSTGSSPPTDLPEPPGPASAAQAQGGVSSGEADAGKGRELFSRPQVIVLLALVCLLGAGLFLLKHRQRLRSAQITVTPGNAEEYAFRVDVNSAAWEEISLLPGIGPHKARAIVSYREENGPFASAGDLVGVPGIGEKTATSIAEYLVFKQAGE